jgi:DNA polymerase
LGSATAGGPDVRRRGPGADEDVQDPFVGRAGQLLTKIIEAIELTREDVYIANVIKCRPPQNRNPEPDEVETCEPFLFRQIDVIKPKVIVALGKFAAQALLRPMRRSHGCAAASSDTAAPS